MLSDSLVFTEPERLKTLCCCGYFVVMDSTHNMNRLQWFLYTIMVWDEHGSWVPGAHMLTAKEDSDICAAGLQTVSFYPIFWLY